MCQCHYAGRDLGVAVEEAIATSYAITKAKVISGVDSAVETRDAIITATKIKLDSLINKETVNPA